jgi:hypothetical protein
VSLDDVERYLDAMGWERVFVEEEQATRLGITRWRHPRTEGDTAPYIYVSTGGYEANGEAIVELLRVLAVWEHRTTTEILDDIAGAAAPTEDDLAAAAVVALVAAGLAEEAERLRRGHATDWTATRTRLHAELRAEGLKLPRRVLLRRALQALGAAWAARDVLGGPEA